MRNKIKTSLLLTFGLVFGSICHAKEPTKLTSDKDLALNALNNMSGYLRTLDKLSIQANLYIDDILDNGQKIQQSKSLSIAANPPSSMKAVTSDRDKTREFYYDGTDFTIYTPKTGYYASFKAPKTISKLIQKAADNYDIEIPLSDLFLWGTKYDNSSEIDEAILVGVDKVNGVSCNHFAFRQKDVDWQVCIQRGDMPLPLKLVITSKLEETQPQYTAIIRWDTAPSLSYQSYTFIPRKGDQKINFAPKKNNK